MLNPKERKKKLERNDCVLRIDVRWVSHLLGDERERFSETRKDEDRSGTAM